jgi:predicted small metal-binding protein
MVKITCSKYGFDCDFEVTGNDSKIIEEYQMHSTNEHGIEQSEEVLEQLVLRMN